MGWNQSPYRTGALLFLLISFCGCRLSVPMYVWSQPKALRSPNFAVAIGNLEGNDATVHDFYAAFLEQRPLAQEKIAVFIPEDLLAQNPVVLASTDSTSVRLGEIGAIQQARKLGTDFLLMGEVIRDELTVEIPSNNLPPEVQAAMATPSLSAPLMARRPEHLTIAWRAVDTLTGERVASFTTMMDRNIADQTYPELVWQHPDPRQRVIVANARETWKSIGPHITQDKTTLAVAWGWPGSEKIRKGVVLAKNHRWMEAEQEWLEVVEAYPQQHRAWHNLSLAAAAREDFATAKKHIRRALELSDNRHYQDTFQWIESRQRAYHTAFDMPPLEEGWAFPEPQSPTPASLTRVQPIDLDSEPWYRVLPGIKPPEWSWYAWLTQPIPF